MVISKISQKAMDMKAMAKAKRAYDILGGVPACRTSFQGEAETMLAMCQFMTAV